MNDLATVDRDNYLLLKQGVDGISLLLHGTPLATDHVIKAPHGGNTTFTYTTSAGEQESKEIDGIVLYQHTFRRWYGSAYQAGETHPPDCIARDNVYGEGVPGGPCTNCGKAKFTTDSDTGKSTPPECQQRMELFLVTKDRMLPFRLSIGVTSLATMGKFFSNLLAEGKPPFAVTTKLTAKKDTTKGGYACTRIHAEATGVLSPEDFAVAKVLANKVMDLVAPSDREEETLTLPEDE